MNRKTLTFIASLALVSLMASGYAYANYSVNAYVYPNYGPYGTTYFCGYDAWGHPQYCRSYGDGYPYPYGYGYPYERHHHRDRDHDRDHDRRGYRD